MARVKPVNPTEVAKELRKDSFIASAMLSEMVQKGLLKISGIKVGSSPLYYDPNQPEHLMNYTNYLNDKDKKTYMLLQEKKVLRENALDPLSRVCVKNLKDFARPLEVSFGETKEIFWKWFLLPDNEAEPIIRQMLSGLQAQQQPAQAQAQPEPQPAPPAPEPQPQPEPQPEPEPTPEPQPEPTPEPAPPETPKPKAKKAKKKTKKVKKKVETQKRIVDKIKEMIVSPAKPIKGSNAFLETLNKYFSDNKITVVEQMDQKRKSEFEFIVHVESSVGPLTYYCHVKDKKRVGEADLSNAFVQGQLIKLPVLFLTTGNLTKGAEKISKDFKGVAVRKI